jgi:hypothetical protein
MESNKFYLLHYGNKVGPLTREELKTNAKTRYDLVWFEGQLDWMPLNKIMELTDVCNAIPPSPVIEESDEDDGGIGNWFHKNFKIVAGIIIFIIVWLLFFELPRRNAMVEKRQAMAKYEQELRIQEQDRIRQIEEEQRKKEVAIATKKLSELNVQLGVAQDRYSRANEFHFLRTSEERENDLKRALSEIEQIEYQRNELLKFINQ